MAAQYWVGGFFIDLSRNQITQNQQSQTLPPKALSVLTYLAENQGKVISHDALLDKIWQDTAVSPNTLQRSITQLRKALGDDGKIYIKTHAKQGYSLECDVRWQDMTHSTHAISPNSASLNSDSPNFANEQVSAIDETQISNVDRVSVSANKPEAERSTLSRISIIAGIMMLGIIGYLYFAPQPSSQLTFNKLRLLTATDDKEFDATYSPDGQYIVFHRYLDKQCVNKMWAKNINTQKEVLLTKDWGAYGSHSFSEDGKQLIFLATSPCNEPATQKNCYDLVSLDFAKALVSPQEPSLILQCKNSTVEKPIWLSDNNIGLMQHTSNRWKLINYSISDNQSTNLYDRNDANLIDYTYSPRDDLIAVTSIHNDGVHYLDMLKPDGRMISSHPIQRPQEIPKDRSINPSFDPLNKQLIFSTGRQLFTLSYEGKVAKINLPFADRMAQPEFHPNGKRLLMLKGPYDSDIVMLSLNELHEASALAQPTQPQAYTSFERSNLGEDFAIFQPGGELIAFWSERSGEAQLWISDGNGPQQLTQFPTDTYIRGIDWAVDGKSLLINANDTLTQVFLDSSQKSLPLEYPVIRLYQWNSQNNSALLALRIKGILKVVEYDFTNAAFKEISDNGVLWALKSEDGRLIYKDYLGRFWQPGPVEPKLIKPLEQQSSKAKSFVLNDNVIYAINTDNQLWSYDLTTDSFKILGNVSKGVDYLTDINQTQLLMTIQVSAKKEVVELSLSE